ncbi:flagellar hook-length control protein FliK [Paenibacillus protaetiae]|uniref:Flagellar hook-length control protein FliK n=1 Tax=Paenibacillus protaetiae TaxID=2509456 RepID=A0A4P6EU37_9BACL|nr:flagellar hook-length control protein FliK [Paenibacillus protaetiae]QAY65603.1 flagellar hook-length control protein FliK [Paenibacillus protaetiae]
MGMNVSQALPQSVPVASSAGSAQAPSGGAGAFQQLVQKAGQAVPAANGTGGAAAKPQEALIPVQVEDAAAQLDGQPAAETLLDLIGKLLEGLQQTDDQDEQADRPADEEPDDLQGALDQLNALFALLGAEPVVPFNSQLAGQAQSASANAEELKATIKDALIELQGMIQQGTVQQVRGTDVNELLQGQLKSIAELISGGQDKPASGKSKTAAEQTAGIGNSFSIQSDSKTAPANSAALLQRLSTQTSNLSVLIASANQEQAPEDREDGLRGQPAELFSSILNQANPTAAASSPAAAAKGAVAGYVNANQFAQSMTDFIVQKFDVTSLNGVTEAKIQLTPEHLGKLDLRISVQNGQLTAIFHADSAAAKDMLDNQMAQLRSALQAQGLTVDKLEVWDGQPSAYFSEGREGRGGNGQQAPKAKFDDALEGVDADFEEEMAEQQAIQHLGYGRAINTAV